MELAFNLLITVLLELPIVGFFFRRKKRKNAYLIALLANIITWPVVNIIKLNSDFNLDIVAVGVVAAEAFIYYYFLDTGWKKALLISFFANLLSYIVTKFVHISPDYFQKKQEIFIQ
ncbi:MAG TPA: hypothetical protein PKC39_14730 [Ferruginibacter sp.]|nr:hypothetical protein [Ferruginibacter sp.]HMP22212.1 hypothetical protein [Ferruginibacter sp.]